METSRKGWGGAVRSLRSRVPIEPGNGVSGLVEVMVGPCRLDPRVPQPVSRRWAAENCYNVQVILRRR